MDAPANRDEALLVMAIAMHPRPFNPRAQYADTAARVREQSRAMAAAKTGLEALEARGVYLAPMDPDHEVTEPVVRPGTDRTTMVGTWKKMLAASPYAPKEGQAHG